MKNIFLLAIAAVIITSCGTSKEKNSKSETVKTPLKKVEGVKNKELLDSKEDLIVVLNEPNKITETKELISKTGLEWDKIVFDQSSLKVGLIKVPADKKAYWLDKLIESGAFKDVKLYSKKALNELIEKEKNQLIAIKKTTCTGDCPSYEVSVSKEGMLTFKGKKFVPQIGKYEFQLSNSDFGKLKTALNKKDFNSYSRKYVNTKATDLQSTYITHKGHEVQIKIWKDVPAELAEIHELIEEVLIVKKLIK